MKTETRCKLMRMQKRRVLYIHLSLATLTKGQSNNDSYFLNYARQQRRLQVKHSQRLYKEQCSPYSTYSEGRNEGKGDHTLVLLKSQNQKPSWQEKAPEAMNNISTFLQLIVDQNGKCCDSALHCRKPGSLAVNHCQRFHESSIPRPQLVKGGKGKRRTYLSMSAPFEFSVVGEERRYTTSSGEYTPSLYIFPSYRKP